MSGQRLAIAFPPGVSVGKWSRIFAERCPQVALDVRRATVHEQEDLLADGVVDVCFVRLPIDGDGLHVIPLYEENLVAAMHDEHVLSLEKALGLEQLSEETALDGEPDESMLKLVAAAQGIAIMPASVAKALRRRDVVARPITDAESSRVALAWRTTNSNPFVEEFVGIVRGRTANSSRGQHAHTEEPQVQQPRPKPQRAKSKLQPKTSRPKSPRTGTRAKKRRGR